MYRDEELKKQSIKNGRKRTCKRKYGDENYNNPEKISKVFQSKTNIEKQQIVQKRKQTNKNLYNNENYNNHEKAINTQLVKYNKIGYNNREKCKQTKLEKYNNAYYTNRQKAKNTMKEKYGVEYAIQDKKIYNKMLNTFKDKYDDLPINYMNKLNKENNIPKIGGLATKNLWLNIDKDKKKQILDKILTTKKLNNSFNTSKLEEELASILDKNKIKYTRQYQINNMYFDFKVSNLLIELNGIYYHNYKPFTNSKKDIDQYNIMKQKGGLLSSIADTWRFRDVQKIEYCKKNNIDLLVLYIKEIPNNIIDIINTTQNINIIRFND